MTDIKLTDLMPNVSERLVSSKAFPHFDLEQATYDVNCCNKQ